MLVCYLWWWTSSPCSTHLELRFAPCRRQNSRQPPPPLPLPGTPSSAATALAVPVGGGLAFLIRQDVQFSHLDTNQFFPGDPITEHQGILANLGGHQIACLNIYIYPLVPAVQLASSPTLPLYSMPTMVPMSWSWAILTPTIPPVFQYRETTEPWQGVWALLRPSTANPLPPKWGLPDPAGAKWHPLVPWPYPNQWPLGPNSLLASLYQPQFWSPPHPHQSRGRSTGLPQIPADTPQQLPSCRLGLIHWLHRVSLFRPVTPLLLFNWRKDFQEYPPGCQRALHPKRLNPQLHPPPLRCSL